MLRAGFLCFAVLAIAYIQAENQERQVGICDEECSSGAIARALQIGGCPVGYECRSNGCGHSCQKVTKEPVFGLCVELCEAQGCPEGYECRSNGCGHTCQVVLS
ncbi:unnamed protein product [Candidula unifasciata]|uniref:Uncharacterized protein n=1 Tax=Candidula unifasciata TaxID=100452 RepID=A0A8S3ZYJ6_9EUPU|nr:unnamed protein product [Candidula unifasciata]